MEHIEGIGTETEASRSRSTNYLGLGELIIGPCPASHWHQAVEAGTDLGVDVGYEERQREL